MTDLLKGAPARILAAILLLQAVAYYAVAARGDIVTEMRPLSAFPPASNGWTAVREFPLENEVQQVLRADDTLNRVYVNPQQTASASLFVAYFKTQRYGQSPHSPKNCLPGAGWTPSQDGQLPVSVPGRANPIVVNRYVIARGEEESMVLYWYQSHGRIIARELAAKVWLVADAVRYHRSDTALVRIIVPVRNGARDAAEQTAIEFVRAVYPDLAGQLPK